MAGNDHVNLFSDKLTEDIKEATRRVLSSHTPPPLAPRYPRRGGGEGGGGKGVVSDIYIAVPTGDIAGTSILGSPTVLRHGMARIYVIRGVAGGYPEAVLLGEFAVSNPGTAPLFKDGQYACHRFLEDKYIAAVGVDFKAVSGYGGGNVLRGTTEGDVIEFVSVSSLGECVDVVTGVSCVSDSIVVTTTGVIVLQILEDDCPEE